MKIIIEYNGNTYEGLDTNKRTAKEGKDVMYANFEKLTKLSLELKDGGFIILGSDALRSCVIKILDT